MIRLTPYITMAGLALVQAPAYANEFEGPLRALAETELMAWVRDPAVLDAVRAQNAEHANVAQGDIDALDKQWRAEVGGTSAPMIDGVLSRAGSVWLRSRKDSAGGLITEVFVTDNHGLNVIQSDVTSDYWQGDEAKFTETFGKPDGTVHLGEVELDESTQTYQSQVSLPVNDPATGESLGAVTFGINLEMLN